MVKLLLAEQDFAFGNGNLASGAFGQRANSGHTTPSHIRSTRFARLFGPSNNIAKPR